MLLTADNHLWFPMILYVHKSVDIQSAGQEMLLYFSTFNFIFPSKQPINSPVQQTNSPAVKPFLARRPEINTIYFIFSVRHSSALLCCVKQPSILLKAIGCNLVPHITDFPSATFYTRGIWHTRTFSLCCRYIYLCFFPQVGKEKIHNQKEMYFIGLEKILVLFLNISCSCKM